MLFYADLHIHSKYSRATSKDCNLEQLALWAHKKGLTLISTGDFTHPAWFKEIQEKLIPVDNGVFKLKPEIEKQLFPQGTNVRFLLSVEISTIYKKWDKTRKVHHVVFTPDMQVAQNFRSKLGAIGNIVSDGRPILGLDSRDLLEVALESGDGSYIIPAHIWTPWFSALGSKSGFDSIEDCYGDLSEHIFAVETGLSSDPEMNRKVSKLDKYRLVSNSDAHSPSKLAREATVFDTNPDYFSVMKALKTGDGYVGTVEFFPEEGKYHEDGHRKCEVCLTPDETKKYNGICPVCGKPLTIGVLNRVMELADRDLKSDFKPETAGRVFSLVPLAEIIAEILQVGAQSKSVITEYERLIQKFGPELFILQDAPVEKIEKDSPMLATALSRLREGKVIKHAGYDGEYGVIKLFEPDEVVKKNFANLKLDINIPKSEPQKTAKKPAPVTKEYKINKSTSKLDKEIKPSSLDEYQSAAVESKSKQILITAGPGSGKTTVLTHRIAHVINKNIFEPQNILAITFTRKAAQEMRERLNILIGDDCLTIRIHTFHSFCLNVLKEHFEKAGLEKDFNVISEQEKELYKDLPENIIEFDDLITKTVKLFKDYPQIKQQYQSRFKYVSVDEYQDIDENQYKLIKNLVPYDGNIFAIGDPNQSIYGFRGGSARFFNNFKQDYPEAEIINLKNNYRSSMYIVNASNQMIDCFNITAQNKLEPDKITIHTAPTSKAEAEFVVSTIENLIGGNSFFSFDSDRSDGQKESYSFGDFAVLYRTSSQVHDLEEALARSGMPFVKLSDDLLCAKKPVRDLLKSLDDSMPVLNQLETNFEKFKDKIEDYIFKYLFNLSNTYTIRKDFIHEVSLIKESDTLDERADRIALMTLHSSKGLEFKNVFIVGLENGIIPLYKAQTAEEIEEERRLLYVGMTRAKQRLYLCRALKRHWFGKTENFEISPFLARIEENLLTLSKFERKMKEQEHTNQLSLF